MEPALRKEYAPLKSRSQAKSSQVQVVTSDRFRTNIQQISDLQRKRDLVFSLQEIAARLTSSTLSTYEYAYQLQQFFEEMIFAETGLQSMRQGLRVFLDKLYAEPVVTKLIYFLFKEMQKCMHPKSPGQAAIDIARLSAAVHEVLNWYIERSANIDYLTDEDPLEENYDKIFNLKVFHDQKRQDFMGMEILTGLLLYGRAGQNLWIKAFFREDGQFILPHVDWNSWIDDTEIFTVKPVDDDVALSCIIPIAPVTQRLIVDRLSLFVPYASLDLQPGKHQVEVEVCLFNEKGDRLLAASSEEVLSVHRGSSRGGKPLVSAQALGLWPKDYVTNDGIDDLEVTCVRQPNGSLLDDLIKLTFDFEIYGRQGESVFVEVRFYNSHGSLIRTSTSKERDQYMAVRSEVYVDEIVFRCFGLELVVPRAQLQIDDDDRSLSCEVCLLSSENKVLCGVLQHFTLPQPAKRIVADKPLAVNAAPPAKSKPAGVFSSLRLLSGRISRKKN